MTKLPLRKESNIHILDFDIEARPLSFMGGDWVTKEITAIAAKFIGSSTMHVWLLGEDTTEEMLLGFWKLYMVADIVTGHYIRNFDLPTINAAMIENDLGHLEHRMSQDTKNDLIKWHGMSKSQENIAGMLGISEPKIQMDQTKWREANRLTPDGMALTRQRVTGDVYQHIAMRAELLKRGMLKPPKMWRP